MRFRNPSYKKSGLSLEIKLRDENYNKLLDETVSTNDKKQMLELFIKLKHKGVNFPSNWFD